MKYSAQNVLKIRSQKEASQLTQSTASLGHVLECYNISKIGDLGTIVHQILSVLVDDNLIVTKYVYMAWKESALVTISNSLRQNSSEGYIFWITE